MFARPYCVIDPTVVTYVHFTVYMQTNRQTIQPVLTVFAANFLSTVPAAEK